MVYFEDPMTWLLTWATFILTSSQCRIRFFHDFPCFSSVVAFLRVTWLTASLSTDRWYQFPSQMHMVRHRSNRIAENTSALFSTVRFWNFSQ